MKIVLPHGTTNGKMMAHGVIETLRNNFKSANDSIEDGFDLFNKPFEELLEELLLKVDVETKIKFQTKFETLQQQIFKANK